MRARIKAAPPALSKPKDSFFVVAMIEPPLHAQTKQLILALYHNLSFVIKKLISNE